MLEIVRYVILKPRELVDELHYLFKLDISRDISTITQSCTKWYSWLISLNHGDMLTLGNSLIPFLVISDNY